MNLYFEHLDCFSFSVIINAVICFMHIYVYFLKLEVELTGEKNNSNFQPQDISEHDKFFSQSQMHRNIKIFLKI